MLMPVGRVRQYTLPCAYVCMWQSSGRLYYHILTSRRKHIFGTEVSGMCVGLPKVGGGYSLKMDDVRHLYNSDKT